MLSQLPTFSFYSILAVDHNIIKNYSGWITSRKLKNAMIFEYTTVFNNSVFAQLSTIFSCGTRKNSFSFFAVKPNCKIEWQSICMSGAFIVSIILFSMLANGLTGIKLMYYMVSGREIYGVLFLAIYIYIPYIYFPNIYTYGYMVILYAVD